MTATLIDLRQGQPEVPVSNRALPWNSRRFPRTYRCGWCRRPATRFLKHSRTGFVKRYHKWWWSFACDDCYRVHHRYHLPPTEFTRLNRRLRWAGRCLLHKRPAKYQLSARDDGRIEGECPDCWQRTLIARAWERAFNARRRLVRRNLQGDVRKRMLRWVWKTEQARGDRTWRQWPQPEPPGPPNGGRRLTRRMTVNESLDLVGRRTA